MKISNQGSKKTSRMERAEEKEGKEEQERREVTHTPSIVTFDGGRGEIGRETHTSRPMHNRCSENEAKRKESRREYEPFFSQGKQRRQVQPKGVGAKLRSIERRSNGLATN